MDNAERFVERLIRFWADIDPPRAVDFFHPEASIRWLPMIRQPIRREQVRTLFERIKMLLPDVRTEAKAWAARGDVLFVEAGISATVGGQLVSWSSLDRFTLHGECAIEQVANFDIEPLRAVLDPGLFRAGLDLDHPFPA